MDIHVGDVLQMKKAHPCGSDLFSVHRVGMDFRIRCQRCGHEVMVPRSKVERSIKRVQRDGMVLSKTQLEKKTVSPSETTESPTEGIKQV